MTQSATDLDVSPFVIDNEQLVEITNELLPSMLDIDISSSREVGELAEIADETAWLATVQIEGDWNAQVDTIVTKDLASRIACSMFSMEPDELTHDELTDAMGEVVNIIGGNIKGVVGNDCKLHLPCVGMFKEPTCGTPDRSLTFDCDGEFFTVSIFSK